MKTLIILFLLSLSLFSVAQNNEIKPDLSSIDTLDDWTLHNRQLKVDDGVHLNAQPGDGLLWLKDLEFVNGIIELDIKGKDIRGRSFVGLAFHGVNDSTFDAIYFRAFNFMNPDRNSHSVQYISHPNNTWYSLREQQPGKFENSVMPIPEPNDWFHITIEVNYPNVKVFVNESKKPSLVIEQISDQKQGWVGFWVGNNSEGSFRNLKIIPSDS